MGATHPRLLIVPPRVWHGVANIGNEPLVLVNAVDVAYQYDSPDHWRVAPDSPAIPFSFSEIR
jgi:dTDP-4-dehydrorhamnose 3,5-epimerase